MRESLGPRTLDHSYSNTLVDNGEQFGVWVLASAHKTIIAQIESLPKSRLRAANNFPAGSGQIVRSNLFLLGHIPFLAGQTSIIIILNLKYLKLETLNFFLTSQFFPYQDKIIVQPSKDLTGQNLFLTGHCPLTGRYLQP